MIMYVEAQNRDVRNGFFKYGSVLRKTVGYGFGFGSEKTVSSVFFSL